MDYNAIVSVIVKAAKTAKVSSALLLAICSHESNDFSMTYAAYDNGSPSYGVCQVKESTARMLGFKGKTSDLMTDKVNAEIAAKYLRYQEDRYNVNDNLTDWCKVTAAYNSGSYNESKKYPGYPRNLRYVRLVQKKLAADFKDRLSCGRSEIAERDN